MTPSRPVRLLLTISILLVSCWSLTCHKQDPVLKGEAKDAAISATLVWARVAPFPVTQEELLVTTEGSMFTRSFRVRFHAAAEDIIEWVHGSPGLRETEPTSEDGSKKYVIKPGGGANRAEVKISSSGEVTVYASWS